MNILEALKMALKSVLANKMRSLLTMLGIIIGVSSVIVLMNLVTAATSSITERLEGVGAKTLNVTIRFATRPLDFKDFSEFAQKHEDIIECVAPSVSGNVTVKNGTVNASTTLEGISQDFSKLRDISIESGRLINNVDVVNRQNVVVIGSYIKTQFYGSQNALGQTLKINGEIFEIVGILGDIQTGAAMSSDDRVYIPYTTAQRLLSNATIRSYTVLAKTTNDVDRVMTLTQIFLYNILKNENAYSVFNQKEMLESISEMQGTMTMLLVGIASISLLVGGIGIMNIMLVSVTERTREIGVRKAIGAKRLSILVQFLIESIVVSGMGGIIGILTGIGGGYLIGNLTSLGSKISMDAIFLSFGFSVFVGIFFGFYPANKASKLNPIEALRYE